jgi:hypothetical protein
MIHSTLQVIKKSSLSALALGGIVVVGTLLPQQAKAFIPAYTTSVPFLGNPTAAGISSSFGFFFDTASNDHIDALGFAGDTNWYDSSYQVKLWSFTNGGVDPGDYTELASLTFTAGPLGTTIPYTLQFNYWWQNIPGGPIFLPNTSDAVDPTRKIGYVISAIGDFSGQNGKIKSQFVDPSTNPSSSVSFNSKIDISSFLGDINGFNDETDAFGYFPVPIDLTPGLGNNGYFNANMSFVKVPSPLPLFGAFAGFSISRRLRKRIQVTR